MSQSSGGGAKAALLALMVLMAAVAVVVADDSEPAGAAELATFSSCEDLTGWMSDAEQAATSGWGADLDAAAGDVATSEGGDDAAGEGSAPTPQSAARYAAEESGSTGATNVIVEGIDELDRVEQLDGDRVLAVGERTLHLVDVAAARSLASVLIPQGAQISFDPERSQIWVAGFDGRSTLVQRLALAGDAFQVEGSWSTEGMLLTARRTGGGFHVIAVDGFGGVVPFAGEPVPCDEVLHPTRQASPEATLIATLPSSGDVVPTAATEIVGAGRFVHLTDDAVFVATPLWGGTPSTSLHRFDLDSLAHTGSGRVDGSLINEFSLSLHDGHLRVALTHGGGGFGVMPLVDDMVVAESSGQAVPAEEPGVAEPAQEPDPGSEEPPVVEPDPGSEEPLPIEPGPGGDEPMPVEPVPAPAPPPGADQPLNEIVVLDTEGDLDVVGRTARFGLPGETLHGIRFVGTTAYAVTFLQTDPFYVVDLANPAAPAVVGEVKLPGFSSYLHPIGDGLVVGFGPGDDGRVAAKLFDVSNPAAPTVADDLSLGDESPVAWDHHAFLALGEGRFAVPATRWVPVDPAGCSAAGRSQLEERARVLEEQAATSTDDVERERLYRELEGVWSDPCLSPQLEAVTSIVEVQVSGGSLDVVSSTEVRSQQPGERVLRTSDGWAVYNPLSLVVVRDSGLQVPVPLT